jgi:hypothetical protein
MRTALFSTGQFDQMADEVVAVLAEVGYSALVNGHGLSFAGNGNLDNGSLVSPEQCLLDLDLTEGLLALWTAPVVPAPGDALARLRELERVLQRARAALG